MKDENEDTQDRRIKGHKMPVIVTRCVYCFEPAPDKDHIQPKSLTSSGMGGYTVPCCKSCNSLLGNFPYFTVEARGKRIAEVLSYKFQAASPPKWTIEEAKRELRGSLMRSVIRSIRKYDILKARAEYAAERWAREDN